MKEKRTANLAVGKNQVIEALKASLADKVFLGKGVRGGIVEDIRKYARSQKVPVVEVPRKKIDEMAGDIRSQGVAAVLSSVPHVELEDIIAKAEAAGEPPLIALLDQIQDPHNLGAIIRSADAAGFHGVVITSRRAAGVTETVFRTSAGAAAHVAIARIPNLTTAIETLKELRVWIAGAEQDGDEDLYKANLSGPIAVVIGGEEKGLRPSIRQHCDFTIRIPMHGQVNSLNASVAAAIIFYEARRQR